MADTCQCASCKAARPEALGPCPHCGATGRILGVSVTESITATATADAGIKRGPQSWAFLWVIAGIALAVILQMVVELGLPGWAKFIVIPVVAVLVMAVILDSGRVHSWIFRAKHWLEDKVR